MNRRGFLGPFNPLRRPGRQLIDDQLILANKLLENGQYLEAGVIFERLAHMAESRNGPRAPRFFFQAGRAFLHAGKVERGMDLLESGRAILERNDQNLMTFPVLIRLKSELEQLGLTGQARIVAGWVEGDQKNIPLSNESPAKPNHLPLRCPSCGASIHPNEVTWLDDITAECDYCGSAIREN